MDLSVVILHYNVRYLLESCLDSVIDAVKSLDSEIIVVDNASSDGVAFMVQNKYPSVHFISNLKNEGYSKGNNIGVKAATGKYLLILNPDTIVNESAVLTCFNTLVSDHQIGAVGVKMADANGHYLEESKRGFPDLFSSICKFTGIHKLFYKSNFFNHYYKGNLDKDKSNEVEVLTGAFLMMPTELYNSIGGFDESFFMYGEDIDLSVRIKKEGKRLIYQGEECIVHLKGRSSTSHSMEYVHAFYNGMKVFVKKYYRHPLSRGLILMGIQISAILSWIKRQIFFRSKLLLDSILIAGVIYLVQFIWARSWFHDKNYFHHTAFVLNAIGYGLFWMICLFFFEAYTPHDNHTKRNAFKAIWIGAFFILLFYSILPEHYRSSRAVILFSTVIISIGIPLLRDLYDQTGYGLKVMVVASPEEEIELNEIIKQAARSNIFSFVNQISPEKAEQVPLSDYSHIVIGKSSTQKANIIRWNQLTPHQVLLKKGQENTSLSQTIPGFDCVSFKLASRQGKWSHRLLQILLKLCLLPWIWINHSEIRKNYWKLISGQMNLIGYKAPYEVNLPRIKPGLWSLPDSFGGSDPNYDYALNYSSGLDLSITLANLIH